MPSPRSDRSAEPLPLTHVMLVGGTVGEWAQLDEERWLQRASALGDAARAAGCRWLTLHPYGPDTSATVAAAPWTLERDGCTVIVDPEPDGRTRLLRGMQRLAPEAALDEAALAAAVLAPAGCDPDLVVVLGPPDRLPPSLVWELAYSELVYLDVAWPDLDVEHLRAALDEYAGRDRRFGGVSS